jgi:hypothetical protein
MGHHPATASDWSDVEASTGWEVNSLTPFRRGDGLRSPYVRLRSTLLSPLLSGLRSLRSTLRSTYSPRPYNPPADRRPAWGLGNGHPASITTRPSCDVAGVKLVHCKRGRRTRRGARLSRSDRRDQHGPPTSLKSSRRLRLRLLKRCARMLLLYANRAALARFTQGILCTPRVDADAEFPALANEAKETASRDLQERARVNAGSQRL